MDTIPDNLFSSGPGEMARHGDLSHDGIKYQLVDNFGEHDLLYNDEQSTWWVEAIKVADDIEKKQQTLQPSDEVSYGNSINSATHVSACTVVV